MQKKFYDFIRYDKDFLGEHGDFSGDESVLEDKDRIEFLTKYSNFLCKKNEIGYGGKAHKVVEEDEISSIESKIDYHIKPTIRNRVYLDSFSVDKLKVESDDGWHYYEGAYRNGEVVYLDDNYKSTSACAKYEFESKKVKRIAFSVFITKEFINSNTPSKNGKPLTTTSGRIVEFRNGVKEILKIQFYTNGKMFVRGVGQDVYHPNEIFAGEYLVDKWNKVEVSLLDNSFNVFLNQKEVLRDIAYTTNLIPNTIFVSGGRYPVGLWKFKIDEIDGDEIVGSVNSMVKENIGTVSLPFVLGGEENKDTAILLSSTINYNGGKAILNIGSVSPSGKVFINDEESILIDNFSAIKTDITGALVEGQNKIEILVNPRAPEVPYSWHRHVDPYNGWFCRDVYVDFLTSTSIENVKVETVNVLCDKVRVNVSGEIFSNEKEIDLKILLSQSFPKKSHEKVVYSGKVNAGSFIKELSVNALLWDTENPNLYEVKLIAEIDGKEVDDVVIETGFRTISQKNGGVLLNGKKIILTGGLIMQFLPPYEQIPLNHVCPTYSQIVMQMLEVKKMNGNTARLHQLGYGTNDDRFARVCDRLGVLLIWTTGYIDSLETVAWERGWQQKDLFVEQIKEVINHPSIIMWEGSNEYHATKIDFDVLFDEFVESVKNVDKTRLLCPCSHMYYGGGIYGNEGFYYQDDGEYDQDFNKVSSSFGWKDPLVVRSAHTYELLLGYGESWTVFREQDWKSQQALFNSKDRAYLITEFAIIGRQDYTTKECKTFLNKESYELPNEIVVSKDLSLMEDFNLSQAYQALCAYNTVKYMRAQGADGLLWCAMRSGANNASYLKPPIDFHGYAKHAFFALKEGFQQIICFNSKVDVLIGDNYQITPMLSGGEINKPYKITINVFNENSEMIDSKSYEIVCNNSAQSLEPFVPDFNKNGYYYIEYITQESKSL